MNTKTCTKCGETKELGAFSKGKAVCKPCRAVHAAECRVKNPEKAHAISAKYYAKNSEVRKLKSAKYYAEHPEKVRAKNVKHYAEHREERRADAVRYKAENVQKIRDYFTKQKQDVSLSYASTVLRLPVALITPELLELKRHQLLNHRALKALTSTLKDIDHEK